MSISSCRIQNSMFSINRIKDINLFNRIIWAISALENSIRLTIPDQSPTDPTIPEFRKKKSSISQTLKVKKSSISSEGITLLLMIWEDSLGESDSVILKSVEESTITMEVCITLILTTSFINGRQQTTFQKNIPKELTM